MYHLTLNNSHTLKQSTTFEGSSYEENPFLSGLPLSESYNEKRPPATESEDSTSTEKDDNLIDMDSFHIIFKSSYVIVMLGSISDLYVNYYWRHWWFYLVKIWMTSSYYFVVHNFIQLTYSLKPLCMCFIKILKYQSRLLKK